MPESKTSAKTQSKESTYVPEDKEKHLYHIKLDKPSFDPKTGKKLSKAFVQKFTVAEYRLFEKNGNTLGYEKEVLWTPEEASK